MKCPNCGAEIKDNILECPECGSDFSGETVRTQKGDSDSRQEKESSNQKKIEAEGGRTLLYGEKTDQHTANTEATHMMDPSAPPLHRLSEKPSGNITSSGNSAAEAWARFSWHGTRIWTGRWQSRQ